MNGEDFNFRMAEENTRREHNEQVHLQVIQHLQNEKKELEQQLAQAWEDKQLYNDSWMHVCKERDQAREQVEYLKDLLETAQQAVNAQTQGRADDNAQARALLIDWLPNEFSLRPGRAEAMEQRTRAFLARKE